ncbi:MAG: hypothetical protein ACE5DS_10410, partial [Kiloniellaceae bacterium]
MTGATDIERQLDSIGADIRRAEAELGAEATVDLGPLQERVGTLCAGLSALPAQDRPPFHGRMLTLMDDLSALARRIESRLGDLKAELSDTAGRTRALDAYGRAPGAP